MKIDNLPPPSDNIEDQRDGKPPIVRTLLEMMADMFKRVPPEARLAKDAGVDDIEKTKS